MVQTHIIQLIVGVLGFATLGVIVGSLLAIRKLKEKTEEVKKHRIEVEISRSEHKHDSDMMPAHR
ncbi:MULTISPECIES: hypothetical protein [Acidobacteriaceae]|uniref:hypothetical protein n=1 Tax=Acidobacteriaceae TaxID=204434 RepID=UPI00131C6569|nr:MULTISPECIES: hypothetical protein [Acidobacteriaceae]MDW5266473.1 hypothetical protein [Edaphobacter sp.]